MLQKDKCYHGNVDCFAFGSYGRCLACTDTSFEKCPFYKTAEQRRKEHYASLKRLHELNKQYLIDKYSPAGGLTSVWNEI